MHAPFLIFESCNVLTEISGAGEHSADQSRFKGLPLMFSSISKSPDGCQRNVKLLHVFGLRTLSSSLISYLAEYQVETVEFPADNGCALNLEL